MEVRVVSCCISQSRKTRIETKLEEKREDADDLMSMMMKNPEV